MTGKEFGSHSKDNAAGGLPGCAEEREEAGTDVMKGDELLGFLNELLEAERAGVEASAAYRANAGDATVSELMEKIEEDGARFCLALADLITRLDGSPSPSTGHFYKRALAVESLGDRIALLSRGQGWAVARICEALPRIRDDEVQGRLEEMANAHYQNKASCDALVGPQQAGA